MRFEDGHERLCTARHIRSTSAQLVTAADVLSPSPCLIQSEADSRSETVESSLTTEKVPCNDLALKPSHPLLPGPCSFHSEEADSRSETVESSLTTEEIPCNKSEAPSCTEVIESSRNSEAVLCHDLLLNSSQSLPSKSVCSVTTEEADSCSETVQSSRSTESVQKSESGSVHLNDESIVVSSSSSVSRGNYKTDFTTLFHFRFKIITRPLYIAPFNVDVIPSFAIYSLGSPGYVTCPRYFVCRAACSFRLLHCNRMHLRAG